MAEIVPRFDFRVSFRAAQDIGGRETNEDAHLVEPELALFAVADGMGGHAAGEVAAELALTEVRASVGSKTTQAAFDAYVRRPNLDTRRLVFARLRRALERANLRVRQDAEENPARRGMGTTADLVWLGRDHAFVAHAGDSRVYLARQSVVLQLTQDHTETELLKATGALRPRARAPRLDPLVNAIGLRETLAVDTLFVDLSRRDRLLLCTDGVHAQLESEAELGELLRGGSAEDAAKALVASASKKRQDNATAIVIAVGERFVRRQDADRGMRARDIEPAKLSALLVDLAPSKVMETLAAAVEIELEPAAIVPQVIASDMVSYIVLEGMVRCEGERLVSVGALLFPESLVGVAVNSPLPVVEQRTRLLRLRSDDFAEVCAADPALAVALYRRLAAYLARAGQRTQSARPPPDGPPTERVS